MSGISYEGKTGAPSGRVEVLSPPGVAEVLPGYQGPRTAGDLAFEPPPRVWSPIGPDGRPEIALAPAPPARPFQDHDVSPRMVNGRSMERPAHRVASVTSVRPARRSAPIARLRRAAMTLGPDRVLTWDLSS